MFTKIRHRDSSSERCQSSRQKALHATTHAYHRQSLSLRFESLEQRVLLAADHLAGDLPSSEDIVVAPTTTVLNSITIIKDTVPDGPQVFEFVTTGPLNPSTFMLDDDPNSPLPNRQEFRNVGSGNYTVTEQPVPGFSTEVSCDGTEGSFSIEENTVSFAFEGEASVTCTYTNTAEPTPEISLEKFVVIPGGEMVTINFDNDGNGGPLAAGTIVGDEYANLGVTISGTSNGAPAAGNRAMIFDSANPTGGDFDLGSPNQDFGGPGVGAGGGQGGPGPNMNPLGNIMILSFDGNSADPNDEPLGGTFSMTWEEPVQINHVGLLDIDSEETGGTIMTLIFEDGSQSIDIPALGDNSFQKVPINVNGVIEMHINMVSSGAVTEVKYTVDGEPGLDPADQPTGPMYTIGDEVGFLYVVQNTGNVPFTPVTLVDDNATPGNPGDDFNPTFLFGDFPPLGTLDTDESWFYSATITAETAGQFTNIATATGEYGIDDEVIPPPIVVTDPGNYLVMNVGDEWFGGNNLLTWQLGHGMTNGASAEDGDFDIDGDVDANDLAVLRGQYGTVVPAPTASASAAAPAATAPTSNPPATLDTQLVDVAIAQGRFDRIESASEEAVQREEVSENSRIAAFAQTGSSVDASSGAGALSDLAAEGESEISQQANDDQIDEELLAGTF